MNAGRRKALEICVPGKYGGPNFIESISGWDLDRVECVDTARAMLAKNDYRAALIHIDPYNAKDLGATLEELVRASPYTEWIGLTSSSLMQDSDQSLLHLISTHCFDYHTLPVDDNRIRTTLGHAFGMSQAREGSGHDSKTDADGEMVGVSAPMQALFRAIRKVATTDAAVFISGESGTGKELTARAVHSHSRRSRGPFVAVDCAALPPTLIQAELFGYEKGAFTGATKRKTGRIEAASGGTLFLDEIGDLPLDLQGNLLRVLEESTIQRLGSVDFIPLDIRIISASNVDMMKAVDEGRFRLDLYHRLNVLQLSVPALRDRKDDIEILARYYFDHFLSEKAKLVQGYSQQALLAMREHEWPGNVRELINRVRRALVMCETRLIMPKDLGLESSPKEVEEIRYGDLKLRELRAAAEKQGITQALTVCGGNISRAAQTLGVSRVTLYQMMRKHDLLGQMESKREMRSGARRRGRAKSGNGSGGAFAG